MNQQVWEGNGLPRLQPGRQHVAAALPPPHQPGWQFNSKKFGLSFSLKNHLSFGLRFPKLIESSNMGSLDMSHNSKWNLVLFFKPKLKPNFVLNCHPAQRGGRQQVPRRRQGRLWADECRVHRRHAQVLRPRPLQELGQWTDSLETNKHTRLPSFKLQRTEGCFWTVSSFWTFTFWLNSMKSSARESLHRRLYLSVKVFV